MPKHGACNLSSINISEYISNPFTEYADIDYVALEEDIKYIVEAMDDVLEENLKNHALKEQVEMAKNYRNIGIGIMGLHDAFIKLGITYGCRKSIDISHNIMYQIFHFALLSSVELGEKRGSFPKYDSKVWDSAIIKNIFPKERITWLKHIDCLRNCSLLSIAPTGSIGTMFNVSTGVEPWFMLHYNRTTKALNGEQDKTYEVWAPIAEEANKRNWHPETLVTSLDINYLDRVKLQGALQYACDTAISSTVNLKKETTIEDIKELYIEAWKQGLKGITIFREGSREPILSSTDKNVLTTEENEKKNNRGFIVKADDTCIGLKRTLTTGCGSLHVEAFFDSLTGELRETYLSKGSKGGCNNYMIGLSRMMSLAARGGVSIDNIIDQLKSCGTCPSYAVRAAVNKDTSKGSCCPVAVGNALKSMYKDMQFRLKNKGLLPNTEIEKEIEPSVKCPDCGSELIPQGGCWSCTNCGYSKCN